MKRTMFAFAVFLYCTVAGFSQYPVKAIRQIQQVSLDSLRMLDTLQRAQPGRWTAQRSPFFGDTV